LQGSFEGGTVFKSRARACYDRYFGKGRSLMPRGLVACRGPFLAVLLAAAFALSAVAGSATAGGDSWRAVHELVSEVCNQTGKGTGDWEVAFGNRVIHRKALVLLSKMRRKGFQRALIERENCVYEVSVIHLSHARANAIAARARRKGLNVLVVQS